ncbi:MAG: pyridoxamine 5'-phosphate oxidase family protein [Propionicimonas sp.]|uniref:pyridoxamine 5'-phosphate oxidase family protein n=1 Tax=Propionicimonas sp. TaxID=1955623 RepID=UPI003D1055E1
MSRTLTPTRMAERLATERADLDALLDEVLVAHIGLSLEDGPLVIPTGFARDGDRLLFHGSTGSRWMRALAAGTPVCVTVTALDALTVARSAFESGMQYRSACLFGTCTALTADEAARALDVFTERVLPGRTAEIRPSTSKELAATMVLALPIDVWSLKRSDDFAQDADADVAGDAWAGVVPLVSGYGEPVPSPDLRAGIDVPPSIRRLATR